MLIEKNAFEANTSTPVSTSVSHDLAHLLDSPSADAKEARAQKIALAVLGVYFLSLILGTLVFGGHAALAWALVSVPLAGLWVLYTTWFVPD